MHKILCVDDESNVLDGLRRILFEDYDVEAVTSGAEALELMQDEEFACIISDMRMPEMNGAEFLSKARQIAPDTTRMLLTGQSDMESAISAINDGNIFRFLMKPCPEEKLLGHMSEAIRLYELTKAEKDLLENTLKGAITVLTDMLSMIAPTAFSRSIYIRGYMSHMSRMTKQANAWEFEIAGMLSQLGAIVLPPDLIKKAFSSVPLEADEKQMLGSIPAAGAKLVDSIPRLQNVALMIESQHGNDRELHNTLGGHVLIGAKMLRIASAVDRLILQEGVSVQKAVETLKKTLVTPDDQTLLTCLSSFKPDSADRVLKSVNVNELEIGMILEADVLAKNKSVVLCKGQKLNGPLIARLVNFARRSGIQEPIEVTVLAPSSD
ncbi:MAG TPA: hypothetical protein DHW71_10140 [Gammaproteobacteria bacterium]|nr:hypothetical protein [Gammaproteobacteria bacterium]HBF07403.1 hypothetical protein [Gammaproteobacteria bacterium]HCK93338.1 hypothetical protein [Gammaproteobacteria bacterium]|tara:strand:+ start:949 stop:2088 length:1140 start_codon:yes stop_codon:yes gene_type:complete